MYISKENKEQTIERLINVLRSATFNVFEKTYFFKETLVSDFTFDPDAIAMIRDNQVWSYLVPAESDETENFKVFSFHFKAGLDNSGFVGWLASTIKEELGTGVFVICGQNSNAGGIFDYWGCPLQMENEVIGLIRRLRNEE